MRKAQDRRSDAPLKGLAQVSISADPRQRHRTVSIQDGHVKDTDLAIPLECLEATKWSEVRWSAFCSVSIATRHSRNLDCGTFKE